MHNIIGKGQGKNNKCTSVYDKSSVNLGTFSKTAKYLGNSKVPIQSDKHIPV